MSAFHDSKRIIKVSFTERANNELIDVFGMYDYLRKYTINFTLFFFLFVSNLFTHKLVVWFQINSLFLLNGIVSQK